MKSRLTLIFSALVVLLGSMVWLVQDRRSNATGPVPALAAERNVPIRLENNLSKSAASAPVAPNGLSDAPMVHVDSSGEVKYTAREGDTVSQLAIALLGSDSKENRDAVIAANPTLRLDPDRVLVGQAYAIVRLAVQPMETKNTAAPQPSKAAVEKPAAPEAVTEPAPKLRYTARMGDTLGALAAHLLGGDTKANRDAIVAENES